MFNGISLWSKSIKNAKANTDNRFYIITLILVGIFSTVNFAYAETLNAYPGDTLDRWLSATCDYGCPINVWASASGNAKSWVYPSTIYFGDVYSKATYDYQLSIPQNTRPGTYTLYWDYECTASGGGKCTSRDVQITINVKSWDTYCKEKFGSNYSYDASTHKCLKKSSSSKTGPYGGYSSWDEHSLEMQRFYNLVCMVYGNNPVDYDYLIGDYLPLERAPKCIVEYNKMSRSWNTLLSPYLRE